VTTDMDFCISWGHICFISTSIVLLDKVELQLFFGLLRSITTAGRLPIYNASKVQCTSNDFVPNSRKVLGSPSPDHDDTMLLQIMPLSLDIRHDGLSRAQLHTSNFPFCGIRLLGFHYKYLGTDALALGGLI